MRRQFTLFIILFSSPTVFCQPKLDALLQKIGHSKEDTGKIILLLDIEKNYFTTDLDSALYYNNICDTLITTINALQYKHKCYHEFVKIYHAKRDYKKAL